MWLNWTCPWCSSTVSEFGRRPSTRTPRWYQFTRDVSVCPSCDQAVELSKRGGLWLLLAVPFAVGMFVEIFALPKSYLSGTMRAFLFLLAIVGVLLYTLNTKMEKSDAV